MREIELQIMMIPMRFRSLPLSSSTHTFNTLEPSALQTYRGIFMLFMLHYSDAHYLYNANFHTISTIYFTTCK